MTSTAERVLDVLRGHNLKKQGNEYRSNSPFRPDSDSRAFTLVIEGEEHGAWHDHVSGESGSLYELAARLGIETPKRETVESTKRVYRDLDDYAKAHGVTRAVFEAAGWCDTEHTNRKALSYPTMNGTRWRFLDGAKPYYINQQGYKSCWYGLDKAAARAQDLVLPLVLCNGEASTVVAQHYGIPAACITSSGERAYPLELVQQLRQKWTGEVWIALDCDATGRKAAAEIAQQLDWVTVRVIDLGLTDGGDLADFCMLHSQHAPARLALLAEDAPPFEPPSLLEVHTLALAQILKDVQAELRKDAKTQRDMDLRVQCADARALLDRIEMNVAAPKVTDFDQLAASTLDDIEARFLNPSQIRGLRSNMPTLDKILGGFTPELYVLYGASNMGKSTLLVSLARELITQAPLLIVPTESPSARWMIKLVAAMTHVSSDKIESGYMSKDEMDKVRASFAQIRTLKCQTLDSPTPTITEIRAAMMKGHFGGILVDGLQKIGVPGANSIYDRTAAICDGLQALYREFNVPVITTSQIGRDVTDRPRGQRQPRLDDAYGGGRIEQDAGCVIGIYNHQYYVEQGLEDANDQMYPAGSSLLSLLKLRWTPGSRAAGVRLQFVPGVGFYEMAKPTDVPF